MLFVVVCLLLGCLFVSLLVGWLVLASCRVSALK